ncbi:TraR/DksA family transcriptional regulator [Streptomyces sp. AHA2]|uniref:TraR/DksA family transcriptional regulator n=1 Tax=Streptomyces sp. AHA2 TaxID=3064526 RepID=UPI002FE18428
MNHRLIADRTTHLTPEELTALRENLLEQRLFRREQLQQLAVAAPSRTDEPRHDDVPSRVEVHVKLVACARMVLADVEAALRRMDEGRYGVCGLCRGPVAAERLAIVPQARYCGRCRQVREAGR